MNAPLIAACAVQSVSFMVLFLEWEWMGTAMVEILLGLLAHTQHTLSVFSLVYIPVSGVGIQPFSDGFFSWLSGLRTLYSLCF